MNKRIKNIMKKKILIVVLCLSITGSAISANASINWGNAVTIVSSGQVVDSITVNGKTITALYAPRNQVANYDSDTTYSCAAFVKRFYSEVYGIGINNLYPGYTPNIYSGSGSFSKTTTPKVGDIAASSEHWAIVKSVSGNNVTLIEQNCWNTAYTAAMVGRVLNSESSYWYWRWSGNSGGNSSSGHNPEGALDVIEGKKGKINVRGWGFDRDAIANAIEVHVYIGGEASDSNAEGHIIKANKLREDVGNIYSFIGAGNYHGFDEAIETNKIGTQNVYVYLINIGGGGNTFLGKKTVTIEKKEEAVIPTSEPTPTPSPTPSLIPTGSPTPSTEKVENLLTVSGSRLISNDSSHGSTQNGIYKYDGYIQTMLLDTIKEEYPYYKVTFRTSEKLDAGTEVLNFQPFNLEWGGWDSNIITIGDAMYNEETGEYTAYIAIQDICSSLSSGTLRGINLGFCNKEPVVTLTGFYQSSSKEASTQPQNTEESKPASQSAVKNDQNTMTNQNTITKTDTKPSKPGKVKLISCKSKRKGTVKVKWKKVSGSDGYWVQWSKNRSFSSKRASYVHGQTKTLDYGLKSKKKYYIRVRAYKEGNSANDYQYAYGSWSKVKKVKVK